MPDQRLPVEEEPQPRRRGGGRLALLCGLLWPGGGQLARGDIWSAICVLLGVAFLLLCCGLELTVPNYDGYPAPFNLLRVYAGLTPPLRIVPQLVVGGVFACALHVGAAVFAARSGASGTGAR